MSQLLRVHCFNVSRDGFGAGEGQSLERPFGHAEPADLFAWAGATASWVNRTDPGGSRGLDDYFTRDWPRNIGAEIMDWLSSGRVTVTFGVGWLEDEFDLLGVPFHERGAMSEEYIQAILALWTQDVPEFDGKYVSFRDIAFEPKPVQQPHGPGRAAAPRVGGK